jgi:hypothetical protein
MEIKLIHGELQLVSNSGIPSAGILFDEKQTAKLLHRGVQTLRNDRMLGRGLPYVKLSPRQVRYDIRDILQYIEDCKIKIEE